MGNLVTSTLKRQTQQIDRSQWLEFLDRFTQENRGAHARLEVLGPDVGRQVETEDRPFEGVSADLKDNESTVWITLGAAPDDQLSHGISEAVVIRALPAEGTHGPVLEVEAKDGTKTILELSPPQEYALPPQNEEARKS